MKTAKNYGIRYVIKFTNPDENGDDRIYYETKDYSHCKDKWDAYISNEFGDDVKFLMIDEVHYTQIVLYEAWS